MAALNSKAADLAGRLHKAKDDLAAATAALEASRRWAVAGCLQVDAGLGSAGVSTG